MNIISKKLKTSNRGFVALFTVLLASVILAMAVGIANISLKQIVLSGSATDANKSFYTADSGVECALYNDIKLDTFDQGITDIDCNGTDWGVVYSGPTFAEFKMDFTSDSGSSCADVTIDKTDPSGELVRITSKGTNTLCDMATSRTVERVIEVTY